MGRGANERRKKRKEGRESFIRLSQPWWYDRLGNPKRFTMLPPTRDNLPAASHNNCTSVSSFPSPPISSLPATLWLSVQDYPSPTPKYHRSVKRYFQGPGSLAVTCWVSAQKAKALHTCRWDKIHTNTLTPELIRHWYSPQMQIEASAFHR